MLVLTRKAHEQIRIGENITISILKVRGNAVRVGIQAPHEIRIVRGELPALADEHREDEPGGGAPGGADQEPPESSAPPRNLRSFLMARRGRARVVRPQPA